MKKPFEKSKKDKEPKNLKEGSKAEEKFDRRQAKHFKKEARSAERYTMAKIKTTQPKGDASPIRLTTNQPFAEPTMSETRSDGSYKGSSGQRTPRVIPVFVSSANRSSGPLK
jgi:hypothetical protein